MSGEAAPDPELSFQLRPLDELPSGVRDAAFDAFRRLYEDAFPLPDEQQDAEDWRRSPAEGRPENMVILAGAGFEAAETVEVWGGIVAEYYPRSRCGLLAYVAVDPGKRRTGLGRRLVEAAVDGLARAAELQGQELRAVFGESEDFRRDEIARKGEHPRRRLAILDRLGARWIDVPYVMPRLAGGKRRDPNLLLLAFPHPRVTLNATTVSCGAVEDFLSEYYELEPANPADPDQSDALAAARRALVDRSRRYHEAYEPWDDVPAEDRQVPLKALPRPADPRLFLSEVAVCLHVVTVDLEEGWTEERLEQRYDSPDLLRRVGRSSLDAGTRAGRQPYLCPIYHSFEIDILSYRFQTQPPIGSACLSETQTRLRVRFPDEIVYVAEGMERRIAGVRTELELRVSLTASAFPETGVRIWHLAFAPRYRDELTEVDLIRLIGLYYSEQEQTTLLADTRFQIAGAGEWLNFGELLAELSEGSVVAERPAAGTIEFDPAAGGRRQAADLWTGILSALYGTTRDDQDSFRQLEALYEDPKIKRILDACCGVVSGHFDYPRMSFAEMQDTLAPDSSAGGYTVWLNRATLTNADPRDQMLERCGRTIGISPYLILPHAVLLHNEFVVDQIEEVARRALHVIDRPAPKPAALETRVAALTRARRRIELSLNRHYIPNVFHYPGERELYDVGSRTRGALEKKQAGERRLAELNARLRDEQELAERRRGFSLTVLSVLLGLTVVFDVVEFFSGRPAWTWWSEVLLAVVILGSAAALALSWPRRRDAGSDDSASVKIQPL